MSRPIAKPGVEYQTLEDCEEALHVVRRDEIAAPGVDHFVEFEEGGWKASGLGRLGGGHRLQREHRHVFLEIARIARGQDEDVVFAVSE